MTGEAGRGTRRDWVLITAAMLVAAIPLLGPAVPPLTDLPGHLGRWAIQMGRDDPFLAAHYTFEPRLIGNLGFDLLVPPLAGVIGLEPAVKLLTIFTASALTGAMLWAAKEAHGHVPPAAGFALPFVMAYPFHFGFMNYCLSLALAFAGLALWLRIGSHRWRPAIFAGIGIVTWLAHAVGWGVLGILIFAVELARLRESGIATRDALIRATLACLPMAIPAFAMIANAFSVHEPVDTHYAPISRKIAWIKFALKDRWKLVDFGSLALVFGAIGAAIIFKPLRFERKLKYAALALLLAFLAMPFMLLGSAYADMRLVAPMLAVVLLAISATGRWAIFLAVAGSALFLVRTAATTWSLALFEKESRQELAALDAIPRNARVLAFVGRPCPTPWIHIRTTHLPSMAIVRRHAFTNDQFAGEGAQLIRIRYGAAGAFVRDPSQMVASQNCPVAAWKKFVPQLAAFPRDAFDFVWLIAPPADRNVDLTGLAPVWSNGRSTVYRIVKNASPPATLAPGNPHRARGRAN